MKKCKRRKGKKKRKALEYKKRRRFWPEETDTRRFGIEGLGLGYGPLGREGASFAAAGALQRLSAEAGSPPNILFQIFSCFSRVFTLVMDRVVLKAKKRCSYSLSRPVNSFTP